MSGENQENMGEFEVKRCVGILELNIFCLHISCCPVALCSCLYFVFCLYRKAERRRGRVVRAARLRCRKSRIA